MTAHKFSRQRELIRNHLQSRCDHPSAEMIYTALKENDPKLSLGTVYRNLRLLSELGQISRLPGEGGPDRYDGNMVHHGHFICRICGGIWDFPHGDVSDQTMDALRSCAATVEHMEITAKGLCPDCVRAQKDPVFLKQAGSCDEIPK